MKQVRGVIFDLDGTLLTTRLNFTHIKKQIGCGHDEDPLDFIDAIPCPVSRADALEKVHQHEQEDAEDSEWIPGAQQFINLLAQEGLPMAIVTRNSIAATQTKVSRHNMPIALVKTRECGPAKPSPDVLLEIASQWSLAPENVMMVGDFIYDIEAARNAKMLSCLVYQNDRPEFAELADYAFPGFAHFQQHWKSNRE